MKDAITLAHILLTDAQNKSGKSADTHKHSSKIWCLDGEMLSILAAKQLGGASLAALGGSCFYSI